MDCFEKYYVLNRRLLCLTGMWPNRKSKEIYFRICIFSLFLITGICDQVQWMLQLEFKIDSIIKPLYSLIPDLFVMVAYYTSLFNSTEASQVIDCMKRHWQIPMTKRELIIMEKYANDSKMYTFVIVSVLYVYCILLISPSILYAFMFNVRNDTELTLPIPTSSFKSTSMMYYTVLLYQIVMIFMVTTIAAAFFTIFLLFVQHACTLFSVVTERLHRPFQKEQNYDWTFDKVKDSYDWIIDITKRYEEAIKFVNLINVLSEKVYLIEIVLSALLIILDFLYLFQMSTIIHNIAETLALFVYIPGSIFILYINCYIGQRLMDHNMQIFETSCCVPFYDIPLKCQKPLLLLIMRSMKPCKLSIGGVFASSHNFFSELMQKSYSYAMVCYTMR